MGDHILEETWKIRDEHAARFNYDFDAIFNDLKRSERDRGLPTVDLSAKRPKPRTPARKSSKRAA